MILVLGGKASGKRTYASSLGFPKADTAFDVHDLVELSTDAKESLPGLVEELAAKSVVTCAEVGSGVVPLSREERAWREAVGTLSRELADRADAVVRMVCGIPQVLKGQSTSQKVDQAIPSNGSPAGGKAVAGECRGEQMGNSTADLNRLASIELVIIRHGQTPGNEARQYVGALDQPLSEEGRRQAQEAAHYPGVVRVYVSKLRRTHETAAIMFPNAEQVVVDGVQEMNFGDFAGRSADEMERDEAYCEWVDGNCEGRCPGGESRDEFTDRVCDALERLLREAAARGERRVYLVAHGGTMMASLWRFSAEPRDYYAWHVPNCTGYRIRVDLTGEHPVFYPESL